MKLTDKYSDIISEQEFPKLHEFFATLSVLDHPQETRRKDTLTHQILLAQAAPLSELIETVSTKRAMQIIQSTASLFRLELIVSGLMILAHDGFLNNPQKSLMKFFKLQVEGDFLERHFIIKNTKDRWSTVEALKDLLPEKINEAHATEVRMVLDELITNALFNAPVDKNKKPLFRMRNREDYFDLPPGHEVQVRLGTSSDHLLILVQDDFGSLPVDSMMKRLHDIYTREEPPSPRIGTGGAGLGFKMILDRCESFYMIVRPGTFTMVGALIPLGKGMKKMFSIPKNIHLSY